MLKPSEWCRKMYDEACKRGDMEAATAYAALFQLWSSRNQ